MRSLNAPSTILETSLRDRFSASNLDLSQNFEETVAISEITERSLHDHADCCALIKRPCSDLARFIISLRLLNDRRLSVEGFHPGKATITSLRKATKEAKVRHSDKTKRHNDLVATTDKQKRRPATERPLLEP